MHFWQHRHCKEKGRQRAGSSLEPTSENAKIIQDVLLFVKVIQTAWFVLSNYRL